MFRRTLTFYLPTDAATHSVADAVGRLLVGWSHERVVAKRLDGSSDHLAQANYCLVQELVQKLLNFAANLRALLLT